MNPRIASTNATRMSWIHEACEHIYSPFIIRNILGVEFPFQNVFCYLCQHQKVELDVKRSEKRRCKLTVGHAKSSLRTVTTLLDYKGLTHYMYTGSNMNVERADNFGSIDGQCGCDEIFDTNFVSNLFLISEHFCQGVSTSFNNLLFFKQMRALNSFVVGNDRYFNEDYGPKSGLNFLPVSRSQERVLVFFNRNNT